MEVNKHINFLKRRGFLIKESSQIELDFGEPVESILNFKSLCADGSQVFCNLLQLADREGIKNDEYLSRKLVNSTSGSEISKETSTVRTRLWSWT